MRGPIERFKATNHALNSRWFTEAPYLHYYRHLTREAAGAARSIVHFGAGSGGADPTWGLFGKRRYVAVDRDIERLRVNPSALRVAADGAALPFRTGSIDLVASEHTFEHLSDPRGVLAEMRRVLSPGGRLVFAVPNRHSYVSLVARCLPFAAHRLFYRFHHGPSGDADHDLTPTFYRLNTRSALTAIANSVGLQLAEYRAFAGGPTYTLALPPPVHLAAALWHKALDGSRLLESLRINLVGALVKPLPTASSLRRD